MPVNWYYLSATGYLTRANTFVRRYTEKSERSGVVAKPPVSTGLSSAVKIPRRKKRSKKRSMKNKSPSSSKVDKVGPVETNTRTKTEPAVVQDSPQMLQFFTEVRHRELREYYLRMKAAERSSRVPAVCSQCRLPRRSSKHPSENIYCSGAQSIRQDLQNRTTNKDWDRYRDLTWLCSSSVAYPHSPLSCG